MRYRTGPINIHKSGQNEGPTFAVWPLISLTTQGKRWCQKWKNVFLRPGAKKKKSKGKGENLFSHASQGEKRAVNFSFGAPAPELAGQRKGLAKGCSSTSPED